MYRFLKKKKKIHITRNIFIFHSLPVNRWLRCAHGWQITKKTLAYTEIYTYTHAYTRAVWWLCGRKADRHPSPTGLSSLTHKRRKLKNWAAPLHHKVARTRRRRREKKEQRGGENPPGDWYKPPPRGIRVLWYTCGYNRRRRAKGDTRSRVLYTNTRAERPFMENARFKCSERARLISAYINIQCALPPWQRQQHHAYLYAKLYDFIDMAARCVNDSRPISYEIKHHALNR